MTHYSNLFMFPLSQICPITSLMTPWATWHWALNKQWNKILWMTPIVNPSFLSPGNCSLPAVTSSRAGLLLYFSGFWLEMAICQGQVTCSGHQIISPVTFKPLTILISQHGNDGDMDGGNQCWIWLMRALIITLINYLHNSDLTRSNNYRSLLYFLIDRSPLLHSCQWAALLLQGAFH